MNLRGKVCVVTGASSGIGRRTAQDLAAEGASLCLVARREERLRELVEELGDGQHSYFVADVSKRDEVAGLAPHVEKEHGRCDVLINNAGISRGGRFKGEGSLDDLFSVMGTNLFGAAHCTAFLLPLLERAEVAHVVNMASVAGRVTFGGASAYSASKFALVGWSEALHYELRGKGIKVTTIEPGPLPTEGFPQKTLVRHPLLRFALTSEEDVSQAIRKVLGTSAIQRTVPRWYYLPAVPRALAPGLYRRIVGRFSNSKVARGR